MNSNWLRNKYFAWTHEENGLLKVEYALFNPATLIGILVDHTNRLKLELEWKCA